MRKFNQELYQSFKNAFGFPVIIISFVMTIFMYVTDNTYSIRITWLISIAATGFIFIAAMFDLSYRMYEKTKKPLPKVISIKPPTQLYESAEAIIIIEPSELFGYELLVSVYLNDDGYDKLLAIGNVITIQQNGYIQILIFKLCDESARDILDRGINNDSRILSNLIIKPSIPKLLF